MKKVLALFLTVAMIALTATACDGGESTVGDSDGVSNSAVSE